MSDSCVRIERMANGYSVRVTDPEIVKANNKRDSKTGYTPWKDPSREYVFKDVKAVLAFLDKNLDKALPKDDSDSFASAFDKAAAAAEKEA